MENFMIFDNTEDAQKFGKTAGIAEIARLHSSLINWTVRFLNAKNSMGFAISDSEHLDKMMILATRRQFCREALEAADVILEPY